MLKTQLNNDEIYTLDTVLTEEECGTLIMRANSKGWNASSPSGGGHGRTGKEDPRTNKFCVFHDSDLGQKLWISIKSSLPPDLTFLGENVYFNSVTKGAEWSPKFVYDKIRVYKYEVGDAFPEHIDYKVKRTVFRDGREFVQQSFMTLLVYLNQDFEGGETGYWPDHNGIHCRFRRAEEKMGTKKNHQVVVTPKAGMAVVQNQNILHEGLPPTKGIKYILRTDIIHEREAVRAAGISNKTTDGKWERLFETSCKNYAD
jgi:prolyl 4-hydroxylase